MTIYSKETTGNRLIVGYENFANHVMESVSGTFVSIYKQRATEKISHFHPFITNAA